MCGYGTTTKLGSKENRECILMLKLSNKSYRYDLPLHQDESTGFILVLIALMAFLFTIVLGFSHGLSSVMDTWSQGLENKLTIEIPATTSDDHTRDEAQLAKIATDIINMTTQSPNIVEAIPVNKEELTSMVTNWLGGGIFIDELPMPVLISVSLNDNSNKAIKLIESSINDIDPHSSVDTHESWLNELFKLTGSLQTGLFVIVIIILLTTIIAIAGAMKAQIEIHRSDLELLHLIGAKDSYISEQFVRHASILAVVGSVIGTSLSLLLIAALALLMMSNEYQLIPMTSFTFLRIISFILVPLLISLISAFAARYTIMNVLKKMA